MNGCTIQYLTLCLTGDLFGQNFTIAMSYRTVLCNDCMLLHSLSEKNVNGKVFQSIGVAVLLMWLKFKLVSK